MDKEFSIKVMNQVLEHLGIKASQLAHNIGLNRAQAIYDVLNPDKNVGISKKMAERIVEKYPQINKTYLLMGEGEVLNTIVNQNNIDGDNIQGHNVTVDKSHTDKFFDLLKAKDEQITKCQSQIDRLIGIIEKLNNNE